MAADQLWWYTARSAGIVAWALLTASVLLGLALSTKVSASGRVRTGCSTCTASSAASRSCSS